MNGTVDLSEEHRESWKIGLRKCFSDVLHSAGTNLAFEDLMIPHVRELLSREREKVIEECIAAVPDEKEQYLTEANEEEITLAEAVSDSVKTFSTPSDFIETISSQ